MRLRNQIEIGSYIINPVAVLVVSLLTAAIISSAFLVIFSKQPEITNKIDTTSTTTTMIKSTTTTLPRATTTTTTTTTTTQRATTTVTTTVSTTTTSTTTTTTSTTTSTTTTSTTTTTTMAIVNMNTVSKVFIFKNITVCNIPDVGCLNLVLNSSETQAIREEVARAFRNLTEWGTGKTGFNIEVIELGENYNASMTQIGAAWWLGPWNINDIVRPFVNKNTDFVFAVHNILDKSTQKKAPLPMCEGTLGADWGIGGAGYSWVPKTYPAEWYECAGQNSFVHGLLHQADYALEKLSNVTDMYHDGFPQSLCGAADANTTKWFPNPDVAPSDPDFPACANYYGNWGGYCSSIQPLNCDFEWTKHMVIAHYPIISNFIGNYCRDGLKDYDETGIDCGGRCAAC